MVLKLHSATIKLLEDIEQRINPDVEDDFFSQWNDFLSGNFQGDIFVPYRKKISDPKVTLPDIPINEAIEDYEKMLISQLQNVSHALSGTKEALAVRANYGTGILSSILGAEIFVMPEEMNTLPTTRCFTDGGQIQNLLEKGIPDLYGGFGRRVLEMGEFFQEAFAPYPNISRYVDIFHPDTQGPLDICELMWGGEMFYAMYDEPEQVHGFLRLVTDTYRAFLEKWYEICPNDKRVNGHWGMFLHKGRLVLRDDSAMNLSPDLYREFALPYDKELLHYFEGGVVHFCGRGDHYIEILSEIPDLTGINMSQPHLNDMEKIYRNTVDKGIPILGFNSQWAQKDKGREGGFHGNLHIF